MWARPGNHNPADQPAGASEPETQQVPAPAAGERTQPVAPAEAPPPAQPQPGPPPAPPPYPPEQWSATPSGPPPSEDTPAAVKAKRRLLRDPMSVVLAVIIVVALLAAGVLAAELYARHRAESVVAAAAECVVRDKVSVSFGPTPFLLEHFTGDYRDISIRTAGNQIRSAKGMKADIEVDNVDLHGHGNSKGTIGALNATITWTSNGIKETVQDSVPIVGGLVNSVTTNPSAGTVELKGALGLGSVTVKPEVAGNGLALTVVKVTAMGAPVPSETAQSALDIFASRLINDFPLGIHADRVQVTDNGVTAHFSTTNAAIPSAQSDPCFAKL